MSATSPSKHGLLLIISGPSGVGKTTITRAVERELRGRFSVSVTTRPKTAADREGVDYRFVDRSTFERMREAGELLEWAEVFGNYYGTPRAPVDEAIAAGGLVILEIDVQGGMAVKRLMPQALAVFILPPSEEVLLQRLRDRKREDESAIQRRFAKAKLEMSTAKASGAYDHFIVNEVLDQAIGATIDIVRRAMDGPRG